MPSPLTLHWSHIALALALTATATSACRRILFCDPETQACGAPEAGSAVGGAADLPTIGAGGGGEGGAGTADAGAAGVDGAVPGAGAGAGAGAGGACEPGFDDCDESTLNGCEARLAVDPWHCGQCGESCAGLCAGGRCQPLQYRSTEPLADTSRLLLGTDHLYFVVTPLLQSGEYALQRVSKATVILETLLEGSPDHSIEELGLGRDRLYFMDEGELWSVGFSGVGLHHERLSPLAFAEYGEWLYWFDADTLKRRPAGDDAGSVETLPLVADDVRLLAHPTGLLVTLIDESKSPFGYELRAMSKWPELVPVAQGTGRIVRLRQTHDGIYWLVDTNPNGLATMELYYTSQGFEAPRLLTAGSDLMDFAVDATASLIYATYTTRSRSGLRVISRELGLRLEVGSKYQPVLLEFDAGRLWFGYPWHANLSHPLAEDPSHPFVAQIAAAALFQ